MSGRMKRLLKLLLGASALAMVLLLVLGLSGQTIGKASGLRIQNYVPPNLTPSVEIVCVVVQENQASDLFQFPN
jgi:hypothetical protein